MASAASRLTEHDRLAEEISARADTGQPVHTTLATSERILARVTDGIYREPWAAFRELVANAYDADASHVVIETGQPDFARMSVRDDGNGMSPTTLAYVLKHIGGSSKRTLAGAALNTAQGGAPDLSPGGRPLIGKIGIGLFAVAQLTQHFQIITKAAGRSHRLSATVRLRTHDEEELQRGDGEYVAGEVQIVSERRPDSEIGSHGTSVVLYQVRSEIRRTLQSTQLWNAVEVGTEGGEIVQSPPEFHIGHSFGDSPEPPHLPWGAGDSPDKKFERFFEATGKSSAKGARRANLDHFDQYFRLLWKLSLSLPLDYIDGHPFDIQGSSGPLLLRIPEGRSQAEEIQLAPTETLRQRLRLRAGVGNRDRPFSVTMDGVALRRPVRLPLSLRKEYRVRAPLMIVARQENPFSENDSARAGGPLSFEAYLYWNSRIVPGETAGVLVRIREASGTLFDPTFLNYQVSEQTRLRQITVEIFVDNGLDSAVNIDRESFNYSHPHFLYVQKWLHRALRLLTNRLKTLAAADLAREKAERRHQALNYAQRVWARRLGDDADPPFADTSEGTLPEEVGGVSIEWPPELIRTAKGKVAGPVLLQSVTAVLEAYGALSNLPIEDRARLIKDVVGIPETNE